MKDPGELGSESKDTPSVPTITPRPKPRDPINNFILRIVTKISFNWIYYYLDQRWRILDINRNKTAVQARNYYFITWTRNNARPVPVGQALRYIHFLQKSQQLTGSSNLDYTRSHKHLM